jgi:hypothetical protein
MLATIGLLFLTIPQVCLQAAAVPPQSDSGRNQKKRRGLLRGLAPMLTPGAAAPATLEESMALCRAPGEREGTAKWPEGLAECAGEKRQSGHDRDVALSRARLYDTAFAVAWDERGVVTLEPAVEYALAARLADA